jgi:hypothetical protein
MPAQPSVGPKKPQSHFEEAWFLNHKYEVRKDPTQCAECHKQEFCQSCHLKRRPDSHLKNWLKFHFGTAREKPAYCAVCHKEEFCTQCHATYSHTPDWLPAKHKIAAKTNGNQFCYNCHKQDFCSGCHNGAKPATHVAGWVQMHGKQVGPNTASCSTCHDTKTFCKDCHQGARPKSHVVGWVQMHGKQMGNNTAACNACHDTKTFCSSCHEGAKPKNHTVKWIDMHGKTAIAPNANCAKCHTSKMCSDCHQTPMPHPKDWSDTHKNFATLGKGSFCYRCHDQRQFCGQCHGN